MVTTTRRGAIAAMAAVPVLSTAGLTAAVSTPAAWESAVSVMRRRKAQWQRLNDIYRRDNAAVSLRMPPKPAEPNLTMSVRDDMTLTQIKAIPFDRPWSEYEADLAAWERQCADLRHEVTGASQAAAGDAWARYEEALSAVASYPVPDLATLRQKVDLLTAEYDDDLSDDDVRRIFTDVRRLAGREG